MWNWSNIFWTRRTILMKFVRRWTVCILNIWIDFVLKIIIISLQYINLAILELSVSYSSFYGFFKTKPIMCAIEISRYINICEDIQGVPWKLKKFRVFPVEPEVNYQQRILNQIYFTSLSLSVKFMEILIFVEIYFLGGITYCNLILCIIYSKKK